MTCPTCNRELSPCPTCGDLRCACRNPWYPSLAQHYAKDGTKREPPPWAKRVAWTAQEGVLP